MTDAEAFDWIRGFDRTQDSYFIRLEHLDGDWSAERVTACDFSNFNATNTFSGYHDTIGEAVAALRALLG